MKWATHADMQAVRSLRPNVKGRIEVSIPLLLGLLQSVLIFALLSLSVSVRGGFVVRELLRPSMRLLL